MEWDIRYILTDIIRKIIADPTRNIMTVNDSTLEHYELERD